MVCNCGCEKVEFQVSGEEWGSVTINKEGEVTFTTEPRFKTLKDVEVAAKTQGAIDELIIICYDCEDETSGKIFFDDGTVFENTDDDVYSEWKAFEKAFPHIPVEAEEE